jgi:flagellar biogenesis protein FliO
MDAIRQMTAVAGVLLLLGAMLWWLRRRGIAGVLPARKVSGRRLECLERLPLGPQHTLHLVRLGETALLVASSPGGCALMQSFPCGEIDKSRGGQR